MAEAAASSADPCVAYDSGGYRFTEFSCMYPALDPFYFEFEKYRDPIPPLIWMQERPWLPIVTVTLYALFIYYGPKAMEKQESWQWRKPMAAWNLFLCTFSFMGMIRTVPHVLHNMFTQSERDNFCLSPRYGVGSGSTGLWMFLFAISKFPELVDTFFLVIHKKNVLFLHWYHHITVLLYTYYGYTQASPIGVYMTAMNYTVHAIMYGYYFLMACKIRPPSFVPLFITCLQISQMFGGCYVTIKAYQYYKKDSECELTDGVIISGFVMYGSYLYLFCQFFVGRYITPKFSVKTQKQKAL